MLCLGVGVQLDASAIQRGIRTMRDIRESGQGVGAMVFDIHFGDAVCRSVERDGDLLQSDTEHSVQKTEGIR